MIKITSTKNVGLNGVKCAVYGPAGIGKTVLCATAPTPIIVSSESGLLSLRDYDIPVIEVKTVNDVNDTLKWANESKEAENFETICLDSITEIAEVHLINYKEEFPDPRTAYGKLADDVSSLIRNFRDLKEKNVYFSAKVVKTLDDTTGTTFHLPSMPGKQLLHGFPFFFDELFYMKIKELEGGKEIRCLQTGPDLKHEGKDRSGCLNFIEKPDLTYIFDKIKKKSKN